MCINMASPVNAIVKLLGPSLIAKFDRNFNLKWTMRILSCMLDLEVLSVCIPYYHGDDCGHCQH